MFTGATGSTSKIVEWPEGTMWQRNRTLSLVAANLVNWLGRSSVGSQLSIAYKAFVGVVCRAPVLTNSRGLTFCCLSRTVHQKAKPYRRLGSLTARMYTGHDPWAKNPSGYDLSAATVCSTCSQIHCQLSLESFNDRISFQKKNYLKQR